MKTNNIINLVLSVGLAVILTACATTYVEAPSPAQSTHQQNQPLTFPEYKGAKTIVAVLPLGLSARAAEKYPHLLEKSVGLGIHNQVIELLYDTGRFRFVEEKPEVVKDIVKRQWLSASGMIAPSTAAQIGKMLGAQKVIYGEVYDFAQGGEMIVGVSTVKDFRTRMGIQVRMVDVETLEYVPGSGVGHGVDVGTASSKAIHQALVSLTNRL